VRSEYSRAEREGGVVDSLGQLKSKRRESEERDQKWRPKLQRRPISWITTPSNTSLTSLSLRSVKP